MKSQALEVLVRIDQLNAEFVKQFYWSYLLPTHFKEEHPNQPKCPVVIPDEIKRWIKNVK